MDWVLLVVRLLLAAVFLVAGVAKLLDLRGSRQAMRDFGVPGPLAGIGGTLLPLVELGIAGTLLPVRTAWAAGIAALALFAIFIAGIGVTMARGRRPDCHCFGQLSSSPVGWRTLARNAVLAGVAGVLVVAGHGSAGHDALGWLGGGDVTSWVGVGLGIAGLLVAGGAFWLLLQLLAQNGRLLTRLEGLEARLAQGGAAPPVALPGGPQAGLPIGSPAPGFQLAGLYGEVLTLDALRAPGKPVLLAFTDPGCGPCTALLPDLARWQRELAPTVTLTLISRGAPEENRAKSAEHGVSQVLLQQDREVANSYLAYGTPSMVLVRPDGTIGSPLAQGAEAIRALVAQNAGGLVFPSAPSPTIPIVQPNGNGSGPCPNCGKYHDQAPNGAVQAPPQPAGVAVGSPAPELKLPDLEGREVDLQDYRGRDTVVLFWNPGCGFCQQLLPQLKEWEGDRPDNAPALLMVSTGTAEANAAHGLASTIMLEPSFQAGTKFGVNGTPSAVKVDRAGNIASGVSVGGPAVMELLRSGSN